MEEVAGVKASGRRAVRRDYPALSFLMDPFPGYFPVALFLALFLALLLGVHSATLLAAPGTVGESGARQREVPAFVAGDRDASVLSQSSTIDSLEDEPVAPIATSPPAAWRISLSLGTLGAGLEVSHQLDDHFSLSSLFQYGRLSADRQLDEVAAYTIDADLRHFALYGRFYPWAEGVYCQLGLVYSKNEGEGYWRVPPQMLQEIAPQLEQNAFNYRFSPLAVAFGVGWSGQWVRNREMSGVSGGSPRFKFGLAFDLVVHGSSEVALVPEVGNGLGQAAADSLRSALKADLDESKILPSFALKLSYEF